MSTAEYRKVWENDKRIESEVLRDEQWHAYAGVILDRLEAAEERLEEAEDESRFAIKRI